MPFTTKIGPTTTMTQLIVIPDATLNGAGVVTLAKISSLAGGVTSLAPVGSSPNADAATLTGSVLNLEPASDSQPGVMSAADKTKLDSLPSGGGAYAHFFALMPGDNAATVAIGAPVFFPQNGPTSGTILHPTPGQFTLPAVGTYEVTWQVSTDEPGQLSLELNGSALPNTVVGRATGTNQIFGNALITTVAINSVLRVINNASPAALTITPTAGGTNPVSATVTIKQVA